MSQSILITSVVVLIVTIFGESLQDCICNVRLRGEYCGTELNKKNSNTDCQTDVIYFCGDGNRNKVAKPLTRCKDEEECGRSKSRISGRVRRRHQCLRRLQCQCPQDFRRGPHCGSNLIGAECPPDVTFICRFGGSVRGRDVCPNGCANGKCVDVSGGDRSDGPEVEEIDTDGDDTVESEEIP